MTSHGPTEQDSARFLERDFVESFSQLRHYDEQIWGICRFAFASYTVVLGAVVGLYQFSVEKNVDLRPAMLAILGVAEVFGLFMFGLVIRNRLYYVVVARYLNEHRQHFLASAPLGFANRTGMYTDSTYPKFYDWRGSQIWLSAIVALLNAVLSGGTVAAVMRSTDHWIAMAGVTAVALLLQLGFAQIYLTSREGKTAGRAVFGSAET